MPEELPYYVSGALAGDVYKRQEKAHFVEGCWKTNQIDEKTATAIFDKIEKFAGYGFNKSHSACYWHISYWTAYLKAHFPVEFLCGLMSNEANNDKIGVFIQEANRMGIETVSYTHLDVYKRQAVP